MNWKKPEFITDDIWISDGFDLHLPNRTGTYIINEKDLTLIDPGPSLAVPRIIKSIEHLGRSLDEVTYIIVTHVHLDHAGGVGLLLKDCPNAKVVVHPRGLRHLIDPARLVKGTQAVYGERFESLFDPVVPIAEEKIIIKNHKETLSISSERTFTFLDTPGHAAHHFSIIDSRSNGIFTGDTIGIQYTDANNLQKEIYLPSTSPNQFDPDKMEESLKLILSYEPSSIFFGHYGASKNIDEIQRQIRFWLPYFIQKGKAVKGEGLDFGVLAERLGQDVLRHYSLDHLADDHPLVTIIKMDAIVSAMGIFDYLSK
ncbi:MBL fold metallo-hydrolase [Alteribacillus sp. YIM 98480]|uniref:MBL fold metallo-hydrolase n=1 Tax=Alteribacillus sp. YIM 98480 TaxID=2606599 RepID=UPI00131E70BF|nr:MBL fold metallo-hydrolase [Alteribacillus sp. YIM 98480]